jgi:sugar phosphate permease
MSNNHYMDKTISNYGYLICLTIFLSYLLVYFHRICPAVIALDMQRAFGVGGALLGTFGSAYFYPYGLMQLPVGFLVDAWGPRRTVSTFLLVAAGGSVLMGMAGSITWAIAGRVLVGIGVSTLFVSNFKLLTEWFRPKQMAVMGGIFMAVGGIGALVASTPLAYLSNYFGWNWTLVSIGGVTLVMAAAVYLIVRDRPSEKGWPDVRAASATVQPGSHRLFLGLKQVATTGHFWALAVWVCFSIGLTFAVGSMWSVPYLQHVYRFSKTQASAYQMMFGVSLIVGSPLLCLLANRIGRKPVLVGSSFVLMIVFAVFYAFPSGLPNIALYGMFFFLFLAGTGTGPIMATVSKELFDPSLAGISVGMINFFPFFSGGLFQVIMGTVLDHSGKAKGVYTINAFQNVFLFCLLGALLSFLASLFTQETLPVEKNPGHDQTG